MPADDAHRVHPNTPPGTEPAGTDPPGTEPPAPVPLAMDPDVMRELGYRVIDMMVDRYTGMREQPAWQGATRAQLDAVLHEPAPETPAGFDSALQRLQHDVLPFGARVDHPRFMAFVPGAPTWPAVLGDMISAGTNVFQGTWLASAGVSAIELVVIDWFRQWLGLPATAGGLLVSGGSAANLTAIAAARMHRFGAHDAAAVIYCSVETHSSVPRAARILGFAEDRVRQIRVDDEQRIDMAALAEAMNVDREAGLVPFVVVANAGTTSTGAVDPLDDIAALCTTHGAWLHVDAAYGGFAALTRRGAAALAGIEHADSIALDPHKWLYQPFEAGCILLRDAALLDRAFHVMPPYLQDTALPGGDTGAGPSSQPLPVNFANRGIQLTRSARAIKIWISIQTLGLAAFRAAIDTCMDVALHAERRIRADDAFELLTPARFGIVCFRVRGRSIAAGHDSGRAGDAGDGGDAVNERALRALLESGIGMISSTRVDGRFALRLCVLNYRTTKEDVDLVLDTVAAWV